MVLSLLLILASSLNLVNEDHIKLIHKEVNRQFKAEVHQIDLKSREVDTGNGVFWSYDINVADQGEMTCYVGAVFTCDLGGCTASKVYNEASRVSSEYFEIFLIVMGDEIKHLKVTNYFSDYGYEMAGRNYTKKFVGKSLCDFNLDETAEVDAISGATISCNSLFNTLAMLCR